MRRAEQPGVHFLSPPATPRRALAWRLVVSLLVAQFGVFELNAEARALASRGFVEEHALELRS